MNLAPVSLSDLGWSDGAPVSLSDFYKWSDGAMVLGKLSVPTCPTNLENRWEMPVALAVGAGRGCLDIIFFSCLSFLYSFSLFGRRSDID